MKLLSLFILTFLIKSVMAAPADDFVIIVKTDNSGAGSDTEFIIYRNYTTSVQYNYNVDCDNDGIDEAIAQSGDYICTYLVAGTYTIRIKDNTGIGTGFPSFWTKAVGSSPVGEKILRVEQWGTGAWRTMLGAFSGASILIISATDVPNFSNVTSMRDMFKGATLANPDTSNWDTSAVTNMQGMFRGATSANPDTSNWDTSSVTDMLSMFSSATSANPDTSNWNTSAVTTMGFLFSNAISANPDTSSWDISNVTYMNNMFFGVNLTKSNYDEMLIGFASQNLQSNVSFHGGYSQYCSSAAQVARASIVANYNWNISDGGVCPEIFQDSFESTVVIFKTADKQFAFDFSDIVLLPEDETPRLIAKGLDRDNQVNIKIYLRQIDGVLEIMQSQLFEDIDGEQLWSDGLWYEVFEQGLSEVNLW